MEKKIKVTVSPCIYEKFEESEIYVFSLNNFNRVCNYHKLNNEDTHKDYLASVCKQQPLFTDVKTSFCFTCYKLFGFEICQNCINDERG